jgi:hypothetical protein
MGNGLRKGCGIIVVELWHMSAFRRKGPETGKRVAMAKKDNGIHTAVTTAPIKGIREA